MSLALVVQCDSPTRKWDEAIYHCISIERQVGLERPQKILRVKDLAGGDNPGRLETSVDDALGRLHYDGRRNRIDIASTRYGVALLTSPAYDRLHEEGLRRASTFVRRYRLGRIGVADVCDWREIHERVNLWRPQMAGDDDDFGEAESYDILRAERRWEIPLAPRRRIGKKLQLTIRKDETPACITLTRQARPPCRLPTIERYRDAYLIRVRPILHRRSGQEIAQCAIERHRGGNHDTRISRRVRKSLKGGKRGRLFRSHIRIMNTPANCGLDEGRRCVHERPGAIDDRCGARNRAVERGGIVNRRHARFRSRMRFGNGVQLRDVSTGKNGCQSAPAQFRNHEAAGVPRCAKDGDPSIRLIRQWWIWRGCCRLECLRHIFILSYSPS